MDVFSAGTVLWEALTGRPLFRRSDDAATISAVLSGVIPPPSTIHRDLPKGLDAVVLKALQRNPDTRYQTAAEFAEALERLPIEGANTRAVGSFVQSTFEAGLAERRALIRQAPEQQRDPKSSHFRPKPTLDGQTTPTGTSQVKVGQISELPGANTSTLVSPTSNEEIEHRRMRGLLAAAMLLLVGSALGLLLARAPTEAKSSSPKPPNHQPTSK
jgi:serine/threonine-protein kinase